MTEDIPPTEAVSEESRGLDTLTTLELVGVLTGVQQRALGAVREARASLVRAVDEIALRLREGGTLHYVGAGTSGRLGVLDAAEAPPTFGTPPGLIRAHIAGGSRALTQAIEGAEDDAGAASSLEPEIANTDAVIGISASGGAAFVVAAVELARAKGAYTIALTGAPRSPLGRAADLAIVLETGAEPLAGSTRMVAGTAQKIALNAISTAVMVKLGRVYDNLMVDVVATNAKLQRRAVRLVRALANVEQEPARALLAQSSGSVKVAVVMQRCGMTAPEAREALQRAGGSLRAVLESA